MIAYQKKSADNLRATLQSRDCDFLIFSECSVVENSGNELSISPACVSSNKSPAYSSPAKISRFLNYVSPTKSPASSPSKSELIGEYFGSMNVIV